MCVCVFIVLSSGTHTIDKKINMQTPKQKSFLDLNRAVLFQIILMIAYHFGILDCGHETFFLIVFFSIRVDHKFLSPAGGCVCTHLNLFCPIKNWPLKPGVFQKAGK